MNIIEPVIGDRVKIISDMYKGSYKLNDEFDVIGVLGDWSVIIIDNDGNEACLWENEFEIL